jgi:Tfp pilus assembly protein PilV
MSAKLRDCVRDTALRPVPHAPEGRVTVKSFKLRRGFLLMEATIATVILAVAAVGIVDLLLSAQQQQQALQENATAVLLARQLIEEIAAKPFGSATAVHQHWSTRRSRCEHQKTRRKCEKRQTHHRPQRTRRQSLRYSQEPDSSATNPALVSTSKTGVWEFNVASAWP